SESAFALIITMNRIVVLLVVPLNKRRTGQRWIDTGLDLSRGFVQTLGHDADFEDRMTEDAVKRAVSAVWRIESPRLIAGLARMVRDVGLAEELAQDALVTALEKWPTT